MKKGKNFSKGAMKTVASIAGGFVGVKLMNMAPTTMNGKIVTFGPAAISFAYEAFLAKGKPNALVDGIMGGLAGSTGARIATNGGISGVFGPDEEKQILLDAFSQVNAPSTVDDEANMRKLLADASSMNAAADFTSSVSAAADFTSSVSGADYKF